MLRPSHRDDARGQPSDDPRRQPHAGIQNHGDACEQCNTGRWRYYTCAEKAILAEDRLKIRTIRAASKPRI